MRRCLFHAFAIPVTTLTIALGAIPSKQADAAGFQLRENDAAGLGRAYAGSAAAPDDAAVAVNNPAAMIDLRAPVIQGDITGVNFSTHFSGSGFDALGRPLRGCSDRQVRKQGQSARRLGAV